MRTFACGIAFDHHGLHVDIRNALGDAAKFFEGLLVVRDHSQAPRFPHLVWRLAYSGTDESQVTFFDTVRYFSEFK